MSKNRVSNNEMKCQIRILIDSYMYSKSVLLENIWKYMTRHVLPVDSF